MRQLSRLVSRFCYNHPQFGFSNLMMYIIGGNVIVFLLDMFSQGTASAMLCFEPYSIFRLHEIWRLVTFIFVPMSSTPVMFALSMYIYYNLGNLLEGVWGTARFNTYYFMGALLNVLFASFSYLAFNYALYASMYYVNLSLFLAYITLYPDGYIRLYFIIPIKTKWMGILYAIILGYDIITFMVAGRFLNAGFILISILNYLVFFWENLTGGVLQQAEHIRWKTNPKTINFKKAQRDVQNRKGHLHQCHICGITDASDPNMEFRYCSRCNGYYCYCINHINDHTHVQ